MHLPPLPLTSPLHETELLERARTLAGLPLGLLADHAGWITPTHLRHAKGWAGQLIELYLGAQAGSRQAQDFPELGIELKTIPITPEGTPLETTYVCIAPLQQTLGIQWQQSNLYNKLQRVLWVPLDGRRHIPPANRRIGRAFIWSPSVAQNEQLRVDWEEITERITLGQVNEVTARIGTVLQLRPKAANGQALTQAIGPDGKVILTRPRGYYLKKNFTQQILLESLADI